MTHKEKAIELLKQEYHCSQALLGAFAGDFGLELKTVFKISTCFSGGMKQGITCGCITGGLLVLRLAFGFSDSQDKEPEAYGNRKTEEYIRTFRERMRGQVYCRDISGRDLSAAGEVAVICQEGVILQNCTRALFASIEILEKMLEEYGGELLSMDQEEIDIKEDEEIRTMRRNMSRRQRFRRPLPDQEIMQVLEHMMTSDKGRLIPEHVIAGAERLRPGLIAEGVGTSDQMGRLENPGVALA